MMDWVWGFVGGLMIGGAAAVYLLYNGRVMGASGIIGELVDRSDWSNWAERLVFLAALIGVPYLLSLLIGGETHLTQNWLVIVLAGLLVGVGTRLANGCTSGHGVCGISRLSLRGIVATLIYVLAGGLTMALLRHLIGVI
ncbi:MAG: YeeE/YedE family protein [Cypionkella sp.]|nr:YeeE/YedE family protein [Cypionkella sp.]MDZ4394128.1 YeeE/YedE family protein [Cypionkella sp.]